ncbi:STAS-like domain-containing protein [Patescibacteria group bacterium]
MDIRKRILKEIHNTGEVRSADIVHETGFSREYVGRFLRKLQQEGKIMLIGRANQARYISTSPQAVENAKRNILQKQLILKNKNHDLSEDRVLERLKRETGIWVKLATQASAILDYGFTEMLNNAIDHSGSRLISIRLDREKDMVFFEVIDEGVGIFRNIMRTRKLRNEEEAIEELMKGKQTTMPKAHSGEGIFFTSKAADILIIQSGSTKLEFNNVVGDIFVKKRQNPLKGTRVSFMLRLPTRKSLNQIFRRYSDKTMSFSKTQVRVKMFMAGSEYISRSQGRRLTAGLDKFKTISLDFKGVTSVGQAFVDEVFRVFQMRYPKITIKPINMNKAVTFMIERAKR